MFWVIIGYPETGPLHIIFQSRAGKVDRFLRMDGIMQGTQLEEKGRIPDSGIWAPLTCGERHKGFILLQPPIGIQEVVRVEGVWCFKVMRVVES